MLESIVRLMQNPWEHTIPDEELFQIILRVAQSRAAHVELMYNDGEGDWRRGSLGLAFLNPAAPNWQPTPDTLLATVAIGPEGEDFIPNAIAKAAYHRDHGLPAGFGVYMDLSMSIDGDFCYGYSTKVDGQIVGASAQTEHQDACEAGHAAVSFLYFVRKARTEWMMKQETRPHWFCDMNEPLEMYSIMAAQTPRRHNISN